jgi:hypothetical protein
MRLVIWNCNMALHTKVDRLMSLAADLAIVPECATPEVLRKKAPSFAYSDCQWQGWLPAKGLGVFAFGELSLARHSSWDPQFPIFLPVEVRGPVVLNLLAVWAFRAGKRPVVAQSPGTTLAAVSHYAPFLTAKPSVVAGDFNARVVWDSKYRQGRFSDVDAALRGVGLASAYHSTHQVPFGTEPHPTFCLARNPSKPYHFDYAYVPKPLFESLVSVKVGTAAEWLKYSDHLPLIIEWP